MILLCCFAGVELAIDTNGRAVDLEATPDAPGASIVPDDDDDEGGIRGARLAGIIVACVVGALILGVCALFAMRHVGREKRINEAQQTGATVATGRGRNEATRAAANVPTADVCSLSPTL